MTPPCEKCPSPTPVGQRAGTLASPGAAAGRRYAGAVQRVLYVAKTHLDVGLTDLAASVRQRYLEEFFPRAMQVAEQLRSAGGAARLRWTTGSWILSEALDAADPDGFDVVVANILANPLTVLAPRLTALT